jgi:hypothetical protein
MMALAMAVRSEAHVLDQYVQASRIDVRSDGLTLEIDLTPGIEIAQQLFLRINTDRDGRISDAEGLAYARQVLNDLVMTVDDQRIALMVAQCAYPTFEQMRAGVGTIHLKLAGPASLQRAGDHQIFFRNLHQVERAIYVVNALVPASPDIAIAGQYRDRLQREVRIDVTVGSRDRGAR